MTRQLKNLIGGKWVEPTGKEEHLIVDPGDGKTVVARMRYSTPEDTAAAVEAAQKAFPGWRDTPVARRCRILFRCDELLEKNREELATLLVQENGKLLSEAEGSIRRGIEAVEFACGMPQLMKGEWLENVASRVDGYVYREPLGVATGAGPFNFPAMIPLWMFPIAVACGNTFVLKPSEKCPATANRLAEIFLEGGLPEGVLNVAHGGRETFESLIVHPDVSAVSFVGSTPAARNVWKLATEQHKRVQALGGAKNYIIVMPDADPEDTVNALVSSAFGCAGERCMAAAVAVFVGDAEKLLAPLVKAAAGLKTGHGLDPSSRMGALISKDYQERVEEYVRIGIEEGAKVLLDGRGIKVKGFEDGCFFGTTIIDQVTPGMRICREEIFGPVLSIMRARNLDEALAMANRTEYGNGHSIFTASGAAAREFRSRIECGMIGINVGVPAPMAFFGFGGRKESLFGDLRTQGTDSVEFYTQKKAVTERWSGGGKTGSIWGK